MNGLVSRAIKTAEIRITRYLAQKVWSHIGFRRFLTNGQIEFQNGIVAIISNNGQPKIIIPNGIKLLHKILQEYHGLPARFHTNQDLLLNPVYKVLADKGGDLSPFIQMLSVCKAAREIINSPAPNDRE